MTVSDRSDTSRPSARPRHAVVVFLLFFRVVLEPCATHSVEHGPLPPEVTSSEAELEAPPDPNMKSVFLFPSAYTLPEGQITLDILSFHALGIRWGVTDRVQVNVGFRLVGLYAGATTRLLVTDSSAFSLDAGVSVPVTSIDGKYPVMFSAGPVYTMGDDDLSFTAGTLVLGITTKKGAVALPYLSLMKRTGRKAKLFIQITDGTAIGEIFGEDHKGDNYLFASPGVRLHGRKFSCDLALIVPLYYEKLDEHYWVAPFPSFSIRF